MLCTRQCDVVGRYYALRTLSKTLRSLMPFFFSFFEVIVVDGAARLVLCGSSGFAVPVCVGGSGITLMLSNNPSSSETERRLLLDVIAVGCAIEAALEGWENFAVLEKALKNEWRRDCCGMATSRD